MTQPENPFAPQGSTDRLDVRMRQGKPMIIKVRDKIEYIRSKECPDGMVRKQNAEPFPNSAIRADVVDLDLQAPDGTWGVVYAAQWFQASSLKKILRPWIGKQMRLVRWDQLNPQDKSSTYTLTELHGDPALVQRAKEFLAANPFYLELPEPPEWDGQPPPPPQPQQQPWEQQFPQQQWGPYGPPPPQQPPSQWNTAAPPAGYYQQQGPPPAQQYQQQGAPYQGQQYSVPPPQSAPPAQYGQQPQYQQGPQMPVSPQHPNGPQVQMGVQMPPQQQYQQQPVQQQPQQGAPGSFFAAAGQQPPPQYPPQQPVNHQGWPQDTDPPF